MKKICTLLLLLMAAVSLPAQTETNQPQRLKVGVVLGGGGAKGASHIGVLKYLEEMGIPVDYVAGTSMGSIIGGFYAMGYSPDELTKIISNIDWSAYIGNKIDRPMMTEEAKQRSSTLLLQIPFNHESLFDNDPNATFISQLPSAYVNNSSLINLFNDLCVGYQEEMDFNDMPIPFACVATDIVTGEEVVLRSGSVPTAMRASMAIPGVFSPVTIGDKVLVDGGLANNFPADVLRDMGADIIIGVEVTSEKKITQKDIQSLPQLLGRLVINGTSAKRKENRQMCDVHIIPDISGFGMLSFTPEAIDILVGRGYQRATDFHDKLLAIKQAVDASAGHPVSKTLQAPHAMNLSHDSVMIRSISINHVSDRDSRWLIRKGNLKEGKTYSQDDIENAMKVYRGTGCFDEITYQIKEIDSTGRNGRLSDTYDLSIDMKPAKPHLFGLGLRYDTEEGAALLATIGLNEKKFNGSKLHFKAKLSYSPRLNLTYTYSRSSLANFSLFYDYRNEHFTWMKMSSKGVNLHYQQQRIGGYISQFHLLNFSTQMGLYYSSTTYDLSSVEGNILDTLVFRRNGLLTPFVTLKYDNLDDAYFAKQGIMARVTARYHYEPNNPTLDYNTIYADKNSHVDLAYAFQSYITPGHGKITIIPQIYGRYVSGSPLLFNLWNLYGGEIAGRHFDEQLPFIGASSLESIGDNTGMLRCDVRYNFYGKHYLTAMYNYITPWANLLTIESFSDVFLVGIQGAGLKYSYNTPLGPVSLTAHWSREYMYDHFGGYFSFGYTF